MVNYGQSKGVSTIAFFPQAKEAVSVFKELARYGEINKAVISSVSDDVVVVDSLWSQRLLSKAEEQKVWKSYTLKSESFKALASSGPYFAEDW